MSAQGLWGFWGAVRRWAPLNPWTRSIPKLGCRKTLSQLGWTGRSHPLPCTLVPAAPHSPFLGWGLFLGTFPHPTGCSSRGGVETHRAEAPGAATSGGHHQAAPQQPPAPAPSRRPQEAAGGGGAGEPHPCGGGITGIFLPCCCCCFPAAPGSTAGIPKTLGIPKTQHWGVLSSSVWVPSSW